MAVQEKFQTRIQDLQKGRAADAERAAAQQQAAVAAAIEKVKPEPGTGTDASVSSANERHLEELRALEDRLTAEHKQELEAAVTAARKEAQSTTTNVDHQAAVAAAIAEHEKEAQARLEHEIAQAVERGRIEQATRGKLKDQALIRTQAKLKELEAQVLEWRKAGLILEASSKVAPAASISTPGPSTMKPTTSTPTTPVTASIPRKPSVIDDVASSADAEASPTISTSPAPAMRGRGLGRGRGMAIRGTAATSGGVPLGTPNNPSGVSILGAAAKRVRDEGVSDDSLAKRLKPVESGSASKPVTLRRDRVPPPP
jgi:nucleoprotein TPR